MGLTVSIRRRPLAAAATRTASASSDVTRVWLFIGLVAAAAGLVWLYAFHAVGEAVVMPGRFSLSWWELAPGFYLAETLVIHLHFRKQAHTLSPSEIPFVLGLFLASPISLLAALVVGGGLAFVIQRRQRPIKVAFNLVQQALCTGLGLFVFHALVGDGTSTLRSWGAALAAAATAHAVGVLLVSAVIAVAEGRFAAPQLPTTLWITVVGAVATACIGLTAVELIRHDPLALSILAVPALVCGLTFRSYMSQREQREQVEFLYESMRLTQGQSDLGLAVGQLLGAARKLLRAEHAVLLTSTPDEVLRSSSSSAGEELMRPVTLTPALRRALEQSGSSERAMLLPRRRPAHAADELLTSLGLADGIVGTLRGERCVLGILVVGGRVGDVTTFNRNDRALFETFAGHASMLLENGRLEQSLAELTEAKEKLRYQAFHDALTELPNRRLFADRVETALDGEGARHAVLVLDLDRFKMINDSWGHAIGDELLVSVGQRIKRSLDEADTAARLGGDEFAVLLLDADAQRAQAIAERLTSALEMPFYLSGREVSVRASVGIAVSGAGATTAEEVLQNADIAMYRAKDDERRRFAFYEPSLHHRLRRRQELVLELERAVERQEFDVHFQPVVSLADHALHAFEVLVRWQHPQRGLLTASEFIGLAEDTGLIREIAEQVRERAFRCAAEWGDVVPEGNDLGLWINLSPRELADTRLVGDLSDALARSSLDPQRLTVEITENSVKDDQQSALSAMHRLRGLGVHLSIDDFGMDWSALSVLSAFPIEMLKVPKPFVDRLAHRRPDTRYADFILQFARSLGLATVGEGIEHSSQARTLHDLGCRFGQGYLFSPALAAADVPAFLSAGRNAAGATARVRSIAV